MVELKPKRSLVAEQQALRSSVFQNLLDYYVHIQKVIVFFLSLTG